MSDPVSDSDTGHPMSAAKILVENIRGVLRQDGELVRRISYVARSRKSQYRDRVRIRADWGRN